MFRLRIYAFCSILIYLSFDASDVRAQAGSFAPRNDVVKLIENLVFDIWEYYRSLPYISERDDQKSIVELIRLTTERLGQLNRTEIAADESTFRAEARMFLVLALSEKILDNPSLASAYVSRARNNDGYTEGFVPETREKLKAATIELDEWLATFGYVVFTFRNFVEDTSWKTINFNIPFLAKDSAPEYVEKNRYGKLAAEVVLDSLNSRKNSATVALKAGKYKIVANKEYVPEHEFEVHEKDTLRIVIEPSYWFKLVVVDTLGVEHKAKQTKIYYYGKRYKEVNLSHMPFGSYKFYGGKKLLIPDSLRSIIFSVKGSQMNREIVRDGYRIVFLDHGDYFYLNVYPKKQPWFILRLLDFLLPI